uniref:Cdc6 C-terminal domain-containing protein n=1 Tax=Micromonas pusilla TaxID=38833 RepID=A0A7S0IGN8_MICPS
MTEVQRATHPRGTAASPPRVLTRKGASAGDGRHPRDDDERDPPSRVSDGRASPAPPGVRRSRRDLADSAEDLASGAAGSPAKRTREGAPPDNTGPTPASGVRADSGWALTLQSEPAGSEFTTNWFTHNADSLTAVFTQLGWMNDGTRARRVIEIGCWEGRSTQWLLRALCRHADSVAYCVDTWRGGEQYADVGFDLGGEAHAGWAVEARFDANVRLVTGVDPNEEEEEEDDNDVTVEGMVTVEERQARLGREPENKPLTPAKASELAEEVENCIEDPEMGFDVDVLLLLHQKVTGFEADCDDALELREMIQRAVRKKTEEAYAYAVSTGKKKPSRRASAGGGARMVSPTTAADGRRAADVRRKFASAAAASPARPSKRAEASRREDEDEDIEDVRGGTRVAMTLGNVNMNARRGSRLNNRDAAAAADDDDDDDMEIADGSTQPAAAGPVYVEIKTEDEEDEVRLSQNDSSFEGLDAAAAEPASPEPSLPALGTAAVVWNAADPHMVNQAKQRLHTSVMPGGFAKCRERERRKVVDIIQGCLKKRRSGSVYVCGLPGTGKSLTVSQAEKMIRCWGDGSKEGGGDRHALPAKQRPRVAAVNCMALSEPRHVFARVIEELGGVPPALDVNGADANGAADVTQLPEVAALRQLVCGTPTDANSRGSRNGGGAANQPTTVVLLDEMDQLICKDQAILYELFGLPTLSGSRCVIVGVANAINLVEVTLPRLAARGCEPTVVSFNAYDKDQLQKLLKQRLAGLPFAVFEDAGLELVARKVAAATGDMRRALNICTNAIDICAGEAARAAEERAAPTDPGGIDAPGEDGTRLVKMHHVARAISASFNSPVVETMRGLPQHQQMVLCAAVRLFRTAAKKETALGVLNDQYTKLCKESKLKGLTSGEFSGVCTVLADLTLLKVGPGREDRQRKVSLGVHADDVVFALQGVNFFRNLIGELNKGA